MEFTFHFHFSFFVHSWHWKPGFDFRFSFSRDIEKQIWILLLVFRFRLSTLKTDWNLVFRFSFSRHFKNVFEFYFSFFVFASLWKTEVNFVFRFCMACYWKTDLNFLSRLCVTLKNVLMHQSFERPEPPPNGDERGKAGPFTSWSLHFCSLVGGRYVRNPGLRLPGRGE